MRDGDIDYSNYTLLELEEALAGINRHQYPQNYANLRSTYEQVTGKFVESPRPETVAAKDGLEHAPTAWDRFWDSRPIAGIGGAVCIWRAFDLYTHIDSCSSGKKLMGSIVNAVCENFGHAVAAGIPFLLGCISVAYAVFPRRRVGA